MWLLGDMQMGNKLLLMLILLLCCDAKFSEQADYQFNVWDETKIGKLYMIDLSMDDDQLVAISYDKDTLRFYQTIYNFDGTIVCSYDYSLNLNRVGWPSQTQGFYLDVVYKYLLKSTSPCSELSYVDTQRGQIQGIAFAHTSKDSYVAIAYDNNQVVEYNIGSGSISRQFHFDNDIEKINDIDYSPDHKYFYADVVLYGNKSKIIIFDDSSTQIKTQIQTDLHFIKGNPNGDGFIGLNQQLATFYNVNINGNKIQVWTPTQDPHIEYAPIKICTDDNNIIAMKISGPKNYQKYQVISYNTEDGSIIQTFQLNFTPVLNFQKSFICNDNYLQILDTKGKAYIFKHSRPLPVWAIILIVLGSLLIIGGIVAGVVIYKRKQAQKDKKYQEFKDEELTKNYL